jgi:hypothetical protein
VTQRSGWARSRPGGSKTAAKYRHDHVKARREAAARHDPSDPCTRCGHPLGPMGRWLHYDHSDDGSYYLGFAHGSPCPWCGKRCNQSAGARVGRERQNVIRIRL